MRVSQTLDSAFAIMMAIQGLIATSSGTSVAIHVHHVILAL